MVTVVEITARVSTILYGTELHVIYLCVTYRVAMAIVLHRTLVHALIPHNGTELTAIYQSAMVHVYTVTALDRITVRAMITLNGLDHNATYLSAM